MTIEANRERLARYIEGTCKSVLECVEILELDPDIDWEDELLNVNMECCVGCGWWEESCGLVWNDARNGGECDQCREKDEDE